MVDIDLRYMVVAALDKPDKTSDDDVGCDKFDPWDDLLRGIHGGYSSESDALMIEALIAVRDRDTLQFMSDFGFAGEFALYVLSGFGYIDYGGSPRFGWPADEISDLWDGIISKWLSYYAATWGCDYAR